AVSMRDVGARAEDGGLNPRRLFSRDPVQCATPTAMNFFAGRLGNLHVRSPQPCELTRRVRDPLAEVNEFSQSRSHFDVLRHFRIPQRKLPIGSDRLTSPCCGGALTARDATFELRAAYRAYVDTHLSFQHG